LAALLFLKSRGRPPLRSDEETRQIVFEAARHAFAVDGYAATSTEELARRAGISTKTLYRLFPGKAALFEAMCVDRLERLLSAVDLQTNDEVDIEAGLHAALLACADLALDPDVVALQRMVLQESAAFPELAANFYKNGISRTVTALAGWLRIQVKRKRIAIAFEGNTSKSASTLRDEVTFFERGAYDDYEASASADTLQRYYQKEGHFFARVDWRRERLSPEEERIVFIVDEGPELKVRGIEFEGNKAFSSSALADVVSVRTFPLVGYIGLGEGGYVTGRQIDQDSERLVAYYQSKGYLEAKAHGEAATSRDALGQIGAVAALADDEHLARSKRMVDEGRVYLEEQFRAMKLKFNPSAGNFVFVNVNDGPAVFKKLLAMKIIVRPLRGYNLPEWLRITVGTMEQNEKCIAALKKLL